MGGVRDRGPPRSHDDGARRPHAASDPEAPARGGSTRDGARRAFPHIPQLGLQAHPCPGAGPPRAPQTAWKGALALFQPRPSRRSCGMDREPSRFLGRPTRCAGGDPPSRGSGPNGSSREKKAPPIKSSKTPQPVDLSTTAFPRCLRWAWENPTVTFDPERVVYPGRARTGDGTAFGYTRLPKGAQ